MSEIINPQDAELEEIILGSCLIESKAITLIADILRPEAFYNEKNLEIYATLQSMYRNGQKIDIITVKEELARRGKLEFIGGPYTLAHISGRVASSAHLEYSGIPQASGVGCRRNHRYRRYIGRRSYPP